MIAVRLSNPSLNRGRTLLARIRIAIISGTLTALAPAAWAQAGKPGVKKAPKAQGAKKKKKKADKDEGDWIEGDNFKAPKTGKDRAGRAGPKGVRAMFESAQKLYDAGKFEAALGAYDALLRKFPQHDPARVQLAKTLYRLDRIKDAYGVFAQVNPQHLDPETAYEYGWSFYTNKQYEGALYAFQRVPKGHALFDLGNYYGAICAIKLKKYEDAEDMLEKAVVLPDKLAKSRSLYIKHVQALRLMKEKGALAKERQAEIDALNKQLAQEKGMNGAGKDGKPAEKGPYVHGGRLGVDKQAKVRYAFEHQYRDNHGYKEGNYDARVATLDVKGGPLIPISALRQGKDRLAAFGTTFSVGAENRITEGKEQRVLADEENDDLTRVLATELGTTDTTAGLVGVAPWMEFPLPEGVWAGFGGELNFTYPEFERGKRSGNRKGYVTGGGTLGFWRYGGDVSYSEILNVKTEPLVTIVGGQGSAGFAMPSKIEGDVVVTYELNDYLDETAGLDGPDALTRIHVKAKQGFPFGFTAGVELGIEQQANYIFHAIPVYGQVSADAQIMSGKAKLSANPFPWLSASLSQLVAKTTWQIDNEAARDPFEQNVADYLEAFTGTVAVNLAF